jgi:N-acetylglucosamine transport system substrate-binding protein
MVLALLAAICLVPLSFAQAKDVKSFSNKTLNVAVFQGGYGRDYWDAIIAEFEKDYPGVKVNLTASPKIGDVIRPQIVSGNPPDFIYFNEGDAGGVVAGMIKDRSLTDLTDVFNGPAIDQKKAIKDLIIPGTLAGRSCSPYLDGKIYLGPYNYTPMGLVYNKNFFDKNNIALPKTIDEFYALAAVAKKFNRALFTYQGIYPGYLEEIYVPAVYAAGGTKAVQSMYTYDPAFWTSDAAKKAFGVFPKIAALDNGLMKGTVALNHTQSQTEMMKGNAMFIVNGPWMEGEMKDAPREEGFTFGFAGFPGFKAGDPTYCQTGIETFMIPSKAKNAALAKEFLRYLYTTKSIKLNAEKANGVFAVVGAADLVKDKLSESTYNFYKGAESMIQVTGHWGVLPKSSKLNIADEVNNPITSLMNGQMTIDQYTAQLDKVWKQAAAEIKAAN